MITPEMKDRVLKSFATEAQLETLIHFPTKKIAAQNDVPENYFEAILIQMQKMGLISELVYSRSESCCVCHAELHDFFLKGGFVAQETIMQTHLQKMYTELLVLQKELEPEHLDKANKIGGIIQSVTGILQFITSIKQ